MKKFLVSALLLIALSLPMVLSATNYADIDPNSLPVFTGSMNDPEIRIVYQKDGYVYVVHNGHLYIYKIPNS